MQQAMCFKTGLFRLNIYNKLRDIETKQENTREDVLERRQKKNSNNQDQDNPREAFLWIKSLLMASLTLLTNLL